MIDLDQYNDSVKSWATSAAQKMQATGGGMGVQHRSNSPSPGASLQKMKTGFKMNTGAIQRISFKFPRSLIYTMKGAGKGRAGVKGSSWADKRGQQHKTNPASFGKMGTGGRSAKPFIDTVLNAPDGVEQLGNLAAENLGSAIINNLLIK